MTTPPTPPKPTGPTLEVPEGVEPQYVNLARIAHSPSDIVIDFAHLLPGEARAKIRSRVVMTPLSAKLLLKALAENISRYEAAFGEIHVPINSTLAENLFRPFQQPPPEPPKE
ncbi:MAG: DUF3467 domain-containing protein [Anaerolineae bacterium]|jgi:hypothetical protein|nr:DUF3467 domain-containing protein [Anaerolineae bacterium]